MRASTIREKLATIFLHKAPTGPESPGQSRILAIVPDTGRHCTAVVLLVPDEFQTLA